MDETVSSVHALSHSFFLIAYQLFFENIFLIDKANKIFFKVTTDVPKYGIRKQKSVKVFLKS